MNTNLILGSVCTVLICMLYCIGRFQKNKKTILALDLLAKVMTILMFFFFSQKTGAASELIGLTVIAAANIKERTGKEFRLLYIIYFVTYLLTLALTYSGFSSLLCTATALISLTSNWWFDPQKMRLADIFICICMFILNMNMGNYAGFTELIIMTCNLLSYIKYRENTDFRKSIFTGFVRRHNRYARRILAYMIIK